MVVQGPGELAVVNPEDNAVIGGVMSVRSGAWVAATADGKTAYVTNEGSNDVSIVDVETEKITGIVPVGNGPRKIVLLPAVAVQQYP